MEKYLSSRVDFARKLLDFGGLLTERCQLFTGFSTRCGKVSRGHALGSPLFEVSCVTSFAFLSFDKYAWQETKQGFPLHPSSRRPLMAVGVVGFRVSYAKETRFLWLVIFVSLFGLRFYKTAARCVSFCGRFVNRPYGIRYNRSVVFLRNGSQLGVGAQLRRTR